MPKFKGGYVEVITRVKPETYAEMEAARARISRYSYYGMVLDELFTTQNNNGRKNKA